MKRTSQSILIVGLDVGYGVTKGITLSASLLFPSVAGYARKLDFNASKIAADYPGDQLRDDDGDWFIGELALSQLRPGDLLRLRGRTANRDALGNAFRVRMAKAAIGKLIPGETGGNVFQVKIATGLPVDHMSEAAALKQALIGQHHIHTDKTDFIVDVIGVMVMPQPYGTIYAQMITPDGKINPAHTATRTGVCDVGTYTVDAAMDDNGEYVKASSGSVESGVYTAHERIAMLMEETYGEKPLYRDVEQALRTGTVRAFGQTVDMRAEVREALEPLRSATVNLLNDLWKSGSRIDVIYLSGGGADLVADVVCGAYRQTVRVDNPQIANARGYLNYALFAAQSAQSE